MIFISEIDRNKTEVLPKQQVGLLITTSQTQLPEDYRFPDICKPLNHFKATQAFTLAGFSS